jgi:cell division protein FtsB
MITKINKNKNRHHFTLFSIFFGILVLLIIGFLLFSNINLAWRRAELINKIEILRKEIKTLEEESQKLRDGIRRAKEEGFLEEKAREELGLKKPGEEVVVILSPKEEIEKPIEERKSFWERIWKWFMPE